jgi:hypothetical protein
MALYKTLEPVTYVDEDIVKYIGKAGVTIELDDQQAHDLSGKISYAGSLDELPEARLLYYDAGANFPTTGDAGTIYLDQSNGKFYRYDTDLGYVLVAGSPAAGDISGVSDLGAALIAATDSAAVLTLLDSVSTAFGVGTIELGHTSDTTISRVSAGQIAVEGVNVLLSGGALGTPVSGTLTNCTGLPIAGLTGSTSTALGVGSIELGHASDTTISRVSAGVIAVEGTTVLLSGAALGTPASGTLTNCTGLPIAGLAASTSTALGVGSIELGHASDTTIARSGAGAITVEGVQVLLAGAALGTPASGTLTNCTGLPISGLTASTATALGVGSIELGHASDTTISRVSAGVIAVEGTTVLLSGAALGTPVSGTLTNCTGLPIGGLESAALDTAATASTLAKRDSSANLSADNFIPTKASTVTAAGTTTLTIDSAQVQEFTGTTTQTVLLPSTGVTAGMSYTVLNNSTNTVTVQSSNGSTVLALFTTRQAVYTARVDTPTTQTDWIPNIIWGTTGSFYQTNVIRDANGNAFADLFVSSQTSTATAAGTTTLLISDNAVQVFTGSTTQTVKLPTSQVAPGMTWTIINNSSGAVTVQSSGANTIATVAANTLQLFIALVATPTTAAHWRAI